MPAACTAWARTFGYASPSRSLLIDLIPAIDLRGGRCVRLYQGDYARETVYSEDPAAMAGHWRELGASRLHIVDLDGAAIGGLQHWDVIAAIVRSVPVPVQVGGGIRDIASMERLLGVGVGRVIIGTAAVEDPTLVREACRRFGQAIIVSVDARNGLVSTRGWKKQTQVSAQDLARGMAELGVGRFIYTDIFSDGTLTRPNFEFIRKLVEDPGLPVIAAGGVSSNADLIELYRLGADGAVMGQALYAGKLDLKAALEAVRKAEAEKGQG